MSKPGTNKTNGSSLVIIVAKALTGINFPLDKKKIVEYARQNNVNENTDRVVDILNHISEQQYFDMSDIEMEVGRINLQTSVAGKMVETISPEDSPNKGQPTVAEQYIVDKNTVGTKFEYSDPTAALNLDKNINDDGASTAETSDIRGVKGMPTVGLAGSANNMADTKENEEYNSLRKVKNQNNDEDK